MNYVLKCSAILAIATGISGCATPPGKLKPEDMDHAKFTVNQPIATVIERLQEADRNCGGLIAEWAPTWYPSLSSDKYKIDLFLKGLAGEKQSWVAGTIDLTKLNTSQTVMALAVQKIYSRPLFRKSNWWQDKVDSMVSDINQNRPIACK